MTDNEKSEGENFLSTLIEGGLPQIIAGPAGKAISRLIGAGVEIPAAYLEGVVQGIRDKSSARSQVSQAIAQKAAEMAVGDTDVMDRALTNMLARSYRVQKNKDAVAAIAVEDLTNNPPPAESEGPSDDWMTKFERHAEDASSDDLRTMFGKLLAGEIRQPGAVSAFTLNFVSMLDAETAKIIERILPYCDSNGIAISECLDPNLNAVESAYVEQSGFWSTEKTLTMHFDEGGVAVNVTSPNFGVALKGRPNSKITFSVDILSRAGKDLLKVVDVDFDFQGFAQVALKKDGVTNFYKGPLVYEGGNVSIINPIELFAEK
jgi:hypothetical protein